MPKFVITGSNAGCGYATQPPLHVLAKNPHYMISLWIIVLAVKEYQVLIISYSVIMANILT